MSEHAADPTPEALEEQMVELLKAVLIRLDEIKDILAQTNLRRSGSVLTADDIYAMTKRGRP